MPEKGHTRVGRRAAKCFLGVPAAQLIVRLARENTRWGVSWRFALIGLNQLVDLITAVAAEHPVGCGQEQRNGRMVS